MDPVLMDPNRMIAQIATRSMNSPLMKYWAPRRNEQIDAMNPNDKSNDNNGDEKKQDIDRDIENKEYEQLTKEDVSSLSICNG